MKSWGLATSLIAMGMGSPVNSFGGGGVVGPAGAFLLSCFDFFLSA